MPIPFIIAGVVAAAGIGGHLNAKETNERAQALASRAQSLYEDEQVTLKNAQTHVEERLLNLGETKQRILEGSVRQFRNAYERVKNIELKLPADLTEIGKFSIDNQQALALFEMSDIYQSTLSSGATGAAAGTVIALAASGSLPIITGVLSAAGTAVTLGEFGLAAEMVGSAFSFGAAFTPLSAVAAPVVLFTGISASMKADENLEKAQVMYSEAEEAVEKMKVAETLCKGIANRADMFADLLLQLNAMFSQCTALMDVVTRNKVAAIRGRPIMAEDFTPDEQKLLAVTRALAGAVKAVIDVPLLSREGELTQTSEDVYNSMQKELPSFHEQVQEVQEAQARQAKRRFALPKGDTMPLAAQEIDSEWPVKSKGVAVLLAIFLGCLGAHKFYLRHYILGIIYLILSFAGLGMIPMLLGWIEGAIYLFSKEEQFQLKHHVRLK